MKTIKIDSLDKRFTQVASDLYGIGDSNNTLKMSSTTAKMIARMFADESNKLNTFTRIDTSNIEISPSFEIFGMGVVISNEVGDDEIRIIPNGEVK